MKSERNNKLKVSCIDFNGFFFVGICCLQKVETYTDLFPVIGFISFLIEIGS